MSEKRKPTTRYQGQRPPKRRQLTPPTPPAPVSKQPTPRQAVEVTKGDIPVKLKECQDLPTQPRKQDLKLPNADYQSIAESGVLAASIQQSRQRWVSDGIFDRYWTRPSKKKGLTDAPNPAKENMVKLGTCTMIIEPHVFDATLYTVREPPSVIMASHIPPPLPPSAPANPSYNPYQDHKTYQQQTHSSYGHGTYPQYHPQYPPNSSSLTLPPFREGFGQFSPSGPPMYHSSVPARPIERSQSKGAHPPPSLPPPPPNPGPESATGEGEKPTDPVIQMLATRAATDRNLKALMKVVASGHASQDQLRDFQNHIDELNNLIRGKTGPDEPAPDQTPGPPPGPPPAQQPHTYPAAPGLSPLPQIPYTSLPPAPNHVKAEPPTNSPYFSHLAPPPKHGAPKPDIVSIVFDFSPNGDRFTFPRFSILEFLPGRTQVIASFLIIRKGNTAAASSGEYNKTLTYYEPVTIRLLAANPKVLEPLTRVVAPPEEVKKYMNGVFDKMSPAKPAYLVTRLPRGKEDGEVETKVAAAQISPGTVKRLYSPPNALVPLKT
ncbi:MAG: hypothetical protein L6R40_000226 [Gallowayella cf. fulva]|nr:MAG: hypothetical protein L6R40_000226 [Xanthomendoza cf. fulva]